MFCPSCGAKNSTEQKFCRSCGMNLERTASSILEQFPNNSRADLQRQERLLEKFGNVAFGGFCVVVCLAILTFIYLILTKMVLSGEQPFGGIILIAFMVFAGLTLTYVIWREALKEKRQKIEATPGGNLELARPTERLLDKTEFEPIPSVTEDTTELLGVKRKTKELD